MALGIDGLEVGVWTSPHGPSGCTVLLPPPGTLGAVAIRGAAPGTREAAALGASGKVTVCHGVVLSGGSAFGLAAADGVVRWLEERGIGYPTRVANVPIVGAAIVLDQGVGDPAVRPGPDAGYAACEAASPDDPPEGSVGAGAGVAVAKVGGLEHAWRSGQGVAVRTVGDVTVGALVVNNAVGEVVDEDGTAVARSRAPADAPRFPDVAEAVVGAPPPAAGPSESTVIGCVATNATLTKAEAVRVADLAHGGVARAVRPAHTTMDGDALFCLATQEVTVHLDLVTALAADVVAEACRRAVRAATSGHGLPGLADGN